MAASLAGCVIVPTAPTSVRNIPSQQRETLKAGESTRADILMRYGAPELRLEDDRILVYQWKRIRAVAVGPTFAVPLRDVEALFLEFDDQGRLLRTGTSVARQQNTIEEQAREWARGSSPAR